MRIVCHPVILLPAILLFIWASPAFGQGNALRGKYLYQEYCANCHGSKGDGRGTYSNSLDPSPPDLTQGQYNCCETDRELFDFIADGQEPMPSWSAFHDSDRWDLISYVRTLKKK